MDIINVHNQKENLQSKKELYNIKILSELIKEKNNIDREISNIIRRPAFIGHAGEYIASEIFDIELEMQAESDKIIKTAESQKEKR